MFIGVYSFFLGRTIELGLPSDKRPDDLEIEDLIVYKDEEDKMEMGKVSYFSDVLHHPDQFLDKREFLRKATANDSQKLEANRERGQQAFSLCQKKIIDHNLEMYLMEAVYSFDGAKINFIFTAEDRVDFRNLVKDLALQFKKQIHLQQIGPRDKAKMIGGIGRCGRGLCCTHWLPKMESISMDMARIQNMANKGSEKLSGLCGKLLCCLKYEIEEYKKLKTEMPALGAIVVTAEFEGEVTGVDVLNKKLKIRLIDGASKIIALADVTKIKSTPSGSHFIPEPADPVLIS